MCSSVFVCCTFVSSPLTCLVLPLHQTLFSVCLPLSPPSLSPPVACAVSGPFCSTWTLAATGCCIRSKSPTTSTSPSPRPQTAACVLSNSSACVAVLAMQNGAGLLSLWTWMCVPFRSASSPSTQVLTDTHTQTDRHLFTLAWHLALGCCALHLHQFHHLYSTGPAIVYCARQGDTESIATLLRTQGIDAEW